MSADLETIGRSEPAKVYPSPDDREQWIVEAPEETASQPRKAMQFAGPNALNLALRYAYEEFGSARFFPF
jgi:hypothetical protein